MTIPPRGWRHIVYYQNFGALSAPCRVHYEVSVFGVGDTKTRRLAVDLPSPPAPSSLADIPVVIPTIRVMARLSPRVEYLTLHRDSPPTVEENASIYRLLHVVLFSSGQRPSLMALSAPEVRCTKGVVTVLPWNMPRQALPTSLMFGPRLVAGNAWGAYLLRAHSPDWSRLADCKVSLRMFSTKWSVAAQEELALQAAEVPLQIS